MARTIASSVTTLRRGAVYDIEDAGPRFPESRVEDLGPVLAAADLRVISRNRARFIGQSRLA